MIYVIDRIEHGMAVCECEDRSHISISMAELYDGAKVGDHFIRWCGNYVYLPEETQKAREKSIRLQNLLFEED